MAEAETGNRKGLADRKDPDMKKWKIGWGVTARCNMGCSFCYSQNVRSSGSDCSLDDMIRFVEDNKQHIESINYGTGENTLSESWFSLVKMVRRRAPQIRQALTTNGFLASALGQRQDARDIIDALEEVDVSLDFAEPLRHNALRGHHRAFDWALETIALCREVGITTSIVMLGLDETLSLANLQGLFEIAAKSGCYIRINILRPNQQGGPSPPSYRAVKSALDWAMTTQEVVSLADPLFAALIEGVRVADGSGRTSLRVLPGGGITASTYLIEPRFVGAHIESAQLGDPRLSDALLGKVGDTLLIPQRCDCCTLREGCRGGAIDRRHIWYGTLDERDYYCPSRHGGDAADWRRGPSPRTQGPSIHDGYLPTLIFAPRRRTEW